MDNKIYELMAQAEVLQEHALKLQNKASEAILEIPEAIDQVKKKLLSVALQSAFIWVITGAIVILGVYVAIMWSTTGLMDEQNRLEAQIERLRKEAQEEEKRRAELKSWGIELVRDKGDRWIKFGKDDQPGKSVEWDDGRNGIEVIRKK